jgi:hypothetical protein
VRALVASALALSLIVGGANAAEVRIEGDGDAEAQRIVNGVAAFLGNLEAAGAPFRFDQGVIVRPQDGNLYRLIVPDFSVDVGSGDPPTSLGRFEFEMTPLGEERYAYRMLPFAPIRFVGPDYAITFQVRDQNVHGEWDTRLGFSNASTLVWRGVEMTFSGGSYMRIEEIESTSMVSESAGGRTVTNPSRATIRELSFDVGLAHGEVEEVAVAVDVVDMPIEVYQQGYGARAQPRFTPTQPTAEEIIDQIKRALGGDMGRQTTTFRASNARYGMRAYDGTETLAVLPRLSGRQTIDNGYEYAVTFDALRVEERDGGVLSPVVTLDHFDGVSRTALDGADTLGSSQDLRFRGLTVHGPYATHFPREGRLAFDLEGIPFVALVEQQAASGTTGDPSTFVPLLLGVLANSGGAVSLQALNLTDGGVRADIESPVRYALSSQRFTTASNRLEVAGLGALVAQMAGNSGVNRQMLGLLSIAMALGRPEVRNGENVHVYEFGNAPDGSLTINGRPIGGLQ